MPRRRRNTSRMRASFSSLLPSTSKEIPVNIRAQDERPRSTTKPFEIFGMSAIGCSFTTQNLACSIVIEAAELLECFQWKDLAGEQRGGHQAARRNCRRNCRYRQSDLIEYRTTSGSTLQRQFLASLKVNAEKYPAEKARAAQRNTIDLTNEIIGCLRCAG